MSVSKWNGVTMLFNPVWDRLERETLVFSVENKAVVDIINSTYSRVPLDAPGLTISVFCMPLRFLVSGGAHPQTAEHTSGCSIKK